MRSMDFAPKRLLLAMVLSIVSLRPAVAALTDAPVSALVETVDEDGQLHPVEPSEVLCSGEAFQVRVAVKKRSYVALVFGRRRSDGVSAEQIYPPPDVDFPRLDPQRWYSLPREFELVLDDKIGAEHLFVVASEALLTRPAVKKLVQKAMQTVTDPPATSKRSCDPAAAHPALKLAPAGTVEHYRDITLRQKLPRDAIEGAYLVRIPIIHR